MKEPEVNANLVLVVFVKKKSPYAGTMIINQDSIGAGCVTTVTWESVFY
jgi:microcompartment protein CcmK/EutM